MKETGVKVTKMEAAVSIISFTEKGMKLSLKLAEALEMAGEETGREKREKKGKITKAAETGRIPWKNTTPYNQYKIYTKCSHCSTEEGVEYVRESVGDWAGKQFGRKNVLVFIGACGIAVRAAAPHITDKRQDSPVLVADEGGSYVIPILSGHMGGANELAVFLAERIGAVPVITTATDLNGKFAVDLFAKKNGLAVLNKEGIAKVSSKALAGETVKISIEEGHLREEWFKEVRSKEMHSKEAHSKETHAKERHLEKGYGLPDGIELVSYPPMEHVDVIITSEKKKFDGTVFLSPKEYVIGMGCRRGKEKEKIEGFAGKTLEGLGISREQIGALATIDFKKDEPGLLEFCRNNGIPFLTYSADELSKVEGVFHASGFVEEKTGVDNVCERAALKACGGRGRLLYEKHGEDGMTIAIAKREWSVGFDEA